MKVITEPSRGEVVLYRKNKNQYYPIKILDGEFWNYQYGRLSNFWHWINLETREKECGYGPFFSD